MIRPTSDGRIRLSRQVLNRAGFESGNRISIIRNSQNSFSIVPTKSVPKNTKSVNYHVESDGRVRISNSAIRNMGVRPRRKTPGVRIDENRITVSL